MLVGLIGNGGFIREVYASMIKDNFRNIHKFSDLDGTLQSSLKSKLSYKYLLCIGTPNIKKQMFESRLIHESSYLKSYVSNHSVCMDKESILLGHGTIVSAGSILTCNITTGIFTTININCTVGHDSTIGNFVTISPGTNISGNSTIGNGVFIGSNSVLRENVRIGDNVTIGMGSVVTKDIIEPGIYAGNPCKQLR